MGNVSLRCFELVCPDFSAGLLGLQLFCTCELMGIKKYKCKTNVDIDFQV